MVHGYSSKDLNFQTLACHAAVENSLKHVQLSVLLPRDSTTKFVLKATSDRETDSKFGYQIQSTSCCARNKQLSFESLKLVHDAAEPEVRRASSSPAGSSHV